MPDRAVLIMVTASGRDLAERLGEGLVVERLAACCSVVPTVRSFYYDEGQLKRDHEALLLVKTMESRSREVQEYVLQHHAYDLPEIVQLPIEGGSVAYLQWVADQVAGRAEDAAAT